MILSTVPNFDYFYELSFNQGNSHVDKTSVQVLDSLESLFHVAFVQFRTQNIRDKM